ncbi:NUDIX domain-containing protein [Mycetocola miduiensis]|uniref:NUDIX domain-containing protein n=1 Tax=Mycetocola miduiensis TaxID=995034 RepID=A0A1I5CTN4_9MICO|nr:NUDIX domain-containing protein [Mycetocola miduiensis]SFN90355.1 NUDIX domain-containing protein [Mycetocola miduiensis]
MTSEPKADERLIVGGLVFASGNRSRLRRKPLLAVVRHRSTTGRTEWTLPQGEVLRSDRTLRDAALRVVSTEIASPVSSSRFADIVDDQLGGDARVGLFWVMEPAESQRHQTDSENDAKVRWVPVDEAPSLLTRAGERELLRFAPGRAPSDDAGRTRPPLFGTRRNDPQLRRLAEEIDDLASQLREAPPSEISEAADRAAVSLAADHIRRARRALFVGDVDTGWGQAFRAREALVARMSDDEVVYTALSLRSEVVASDKIKQWRQDAVTALVKPILDRERRPWLRTPPRGNRDALREALLIRNESFSNEYRKLTILRRHQKHLLWTGVVALALVLASLIGIGFLREPIADRWLAFAALATGVVGAVVSAAQRSTRVPQMRIPQAYNSYVSSLSRVAIGGVAGLLVFLAASAVEGQQINAASILIAAFGAGFAERLVTERPSS